MSGVSTQQPPAFPVSTGSRPNPLCVWHAHLTAMQRRQQELEELVREQGAQIKELEHVLRERTLTSA